MRRGTDCQCLHCEVIDIMADRLDDGESPSAIFGRVLEALAEFATWNKNPLGCKSMVDAAVVRLPVLVDEIYAKQHGDRVN